MICKRCGKNIWKFIIDNTKNPLIICDSCGYSVQTKEIIGEKVTIKIEE